MPAQLPRRGCAGIYYFIARISVKDIKLSLEVLCSRCLFSWLESSYRLAVASVRWTLAGKKEPPTFVGGFVFALPVLAVRATILFLKRAGGTF